jgi:Tol biopolymer transport system component/tRNA A-37 threonylcarbamoyl transferase component Bud32
MDERWEEIERIYHAARDLDQSARAEFLAEACGEDAELRRKVESLLVQADQDKSFMESPAIEVAAELLGKDKVFSRPRNAELESGAMIAHYCVTTKLGQGGMGVVYRARDTKLQRDVALKILPETMARDAQRMARFEREAQVLASLNHPNIAAIHGLEESNGIRALVMELVEGKTLAERISVAAGFSPAHAGLKAGSTTTERTSSLAIDDTLPIAHQVAEALEYAHERGVIHRDLKPANVKITPEGTVKVLDFGLAKVLSPQDSASGLDPANSPSLSAMATQAGMILGTAAYMSPEQAKGQRVDRRCDIWAFGCVLYEMITGRKTFGGETVSDVLAAVIRAEPDWNALPATTPPSIQRLIRRCLQKDQRQRLRDIGEARILIEETISGVGEGSALPTDSVALREPKGLLYRALPWAIAGILICLGVFAGWWFGTRNVATGPKHVMRFTVAPPENTTLSGDAGMSLSPDGRKLAFVTAPSPSQPAKLWVRPLDSLTAKALQGTEGAQHPFWSPDGNDLGFYADGKLEKVAISGGPPQTLCKAEGNGATWNRNGVIVFTSRRRLYRVPETGGAPALVAAPDEALDEGWYVAPQFLPDGRHFLFLILRAHFVGNKFSIGLGSLDSKEVERLSAAGSKALYASPGYLLYMDQTTLMARPFDAGGLKFTGQAVSIAEGVGPGFMGGGHFTVSQTGALAYQTGGSETLSQMVWMNRKGEKVETVGKPGLYTSPAVSPDGTKIAVGVGPHMGGDLWVYDLKRGSASRLTFNPAGDEYPVWSADGKWIFFTSSRHGRRDLYQKPASGLGSTQPLYVSRQQIKDLDDLSPDGRYAIYDAGPGRALWVLPRFGGKKPSTFIHEKFMVKDAKISPNGRYVAYMSTETGRPEAYVQTFPRHQGKWQVSTAGGSEPMWRGDGRELFYLSPGDGVMAVAVNTAAGQFQAGPPKLLFQAHLIPQGILRNTYAVSPDGQRFLLLEPATGGKSSPINVVLNWPVLLKNAGK